MAAATAKVPGVYGKLVQLAETVGAIKKGERNKAQNYSFRGIDTVMAVVHPKLIELGLALTSEVLSYQIDGPHENKKGTQWTSVAVHMRYTFTDTKDGSQASFEALGYSIDYQDKAGNQAMSQALKMALLQGLTSPTDEPDADARAPHKEAEAAEPPTAQELLWGAKKVVLDMMNGDKKEAATLWKSATAAVSLTDDDITADGHVNAVLQAAEQILQSEADDG